VRTYKLDYPRLEREVERKGTVNNLLCLFDHDPCLLIPNMLLDCPPKYWYAM